MNNIVKANFQRVQYKLLFLPIIILFGVIIFLIAQGNFSPEGYVLAQKDLFLFLNRILSQFPSLQYNLTQLGDAFVALSLFSVFIIYAPRVWEAIFPASLLSILFSQGLKQLFDIPRPATILGAENINIIGKTLQGYSSMPSGHSITILSYFGILILAFLPRKLSLKISYLLIAIPICLSFALTRVGVGAHHPFDVLIGSCLGYISAILGVIFSRKFKIFSYIFSYKAYPFFILIFSVSIFVFVYKIMNENLLIFYFPIISLLLSLQMMIKKMANKKYKIE